MVPGLIAGDEKYAHASSIVLLVVWVGCIFSVIILLNLGLYRFEQAVFVPIYLILGCLYAIWVGILYFQTYKRMTTLKWVGLSVGIALLVLGIWLASLREHRPQDELQTRLRQSISEWDRRFSTASGRKRQGRR